MTGGINIFGGVGLLISPNRPHLEVCGRKLEDDVYWDRDTYDIGGDWTMNGGRYDNHYVSRFYVDKDGIIFKS